MAIKPKVNTNLPPSKEDLEKKAVYDERLSRLINRNVVKFKRQKKPLKKYNQIYEQRQKDREGMYKMLSTHNSAEDEDKQDQARDEDMNKSFLAVNSTQEPISGGL